MDKAAFFRVEGTLSRRPTITAAAWLAANAQGIGERFARLGNVALAAPLKLMGELQAGATATRMTWMGLRAMTEDRLHVLADEYVETYLRDDVPEVGRELILLARKQSRRVVLISDNIDLIVSPIAELVGADDLICNRLEFKNGSATGRLVDPVIGGSVAGQWARAFARDNNIDLSISSAYGTQASDSLLLSAIGEPCVVNPDRQLRRLARDHQWPVLER